MISLSALWSLRSLQTAPAAALLGLAPSLRGEGAPPQNLENWPRGAGDREEGSLARVGEREAARSPSGCPPRSSSSWWTSLSTWELLAWLTKRPLPPSSTVLRAVVGREGTVAGRGSCRDWKRAAPSRPCCSREGGLGGSNLWD